MPIADSNTAAGGHPRTRPAQSGSVAAEQGPRTLGGACGNLVGRAEELDRLGSAFDVMAGGRALTVLVGGDAGIGKSRLVEEFCDRVRLRGGVVATGMCVPPDGGLPYAPVMGVLRGLGRQLGQPSAAQLLRALGADADPESSAAAEPASPYPPLAPVGGQFAKTMFFESILGALVDIAERTPLLLVFEDLQWADSGSAQLLDFLTRSFGDTRVLIVGTYRAEDFDSNHPLTPWLTELGRHPRVTQLDVGGLHRADLATLITDRTGRSPDPVLLDSVWTRSQGNPFFAEELLNARSTSSLPTALQAVIISRVKELSSQAQHILALAAVAGAVVDHRLLARLGGQDADALAASITETVDKNILVIDPSRSGYRFRHALLREAVCDSLLPAQCSRLHYEVATALAADPSLALSAPSHRVAELASHWWAAGEWAAALQPSLDAVDAALAVSAFPEALIFLEHALVAAERMPDAAMTAGVNRSQLLEQAADVAYLAGANARAVELALAAIEAIDEQDDPVGAARCYTLLGRNAWGVGDSEAAFDAYREAVELLPADPPSVELARLLAEEARGFMLMSLNGPGEERAREAIAVARVLGARDVEGHALNTLGCCRGILGFYDEAIALIQESLAIAEELASPDDLNRAYGNLASILLDVGRLEDAASIMFDSAAVGEQLWGVRLNGATGNGVEALVRLGRYAEAEQVLAQLGAHALGVCAPGPWTLPTPMLIRRGRFEVAQRTVAMALEMTSRLEDVQQGAWVLGLAAELDLEQDRPDAAAACIEQALVLTSRSQDETQLPELCMWAARAVADQCAAARAHGHPMDIEDMRRRSDEVVASVHRTVVQREKRGATPTPRALAADAQAAAERSRLDRSDPDKWHHAAQRWDAAREPYPRAYCRWREAEALLETRAGRARAGERLNDAWQIVRELGAEPLSARIVSLAQRGRLELHDADAGDIAPEARVAADLGLTAREVEVLGQVAVGRSDREIGESLFISKKTVSVHVSNVLRKLAVANRVEAGKVGQAHGLGGLPALIESTRTV